MTIQQKNKAVVKLGSTDPKSRKAAMKVLVDIEGFCTYTVDLEKSTLVVMGYMDPTMLVYKLRKFVCADLVTFGPEKDEGKPPKNTDGGGGNVDQPQKPPPSPTFYGHSNYGHCHGYNYSYPYN